MRMTALAVVLLLAADVAAQSPLLERTPDHRVSNGWHDHVDEDEGRRDRYRIDLTRAPRLQNTMSWSMRGFVAQLDLDSARGKLEGTDAELSAGWFFRDAVGVGARMAFGDRKGSGSFTRYEAFADYRLSANASLGLRYVNERVAEFDQTTNALVLGLTYRR